MAGRLLDRKKRRLPCEVRSGHKHHSGMVLDVSASGVFIQTSALVNPGDELEIEVAVPGSPEPVLMRGEVARRKSVPPQLRTVAQGGIGVRITSAPEAYYRFMQSLDCDWEGEPSPTASPASTRPPASKADPAARAEFPSAGPRSEPPASTEQAYLVRVKQTTGPRTKRLFVDADSADAAREAALKQLGEGWKILEVSDAAP